MKIILCTGDSHTCGEGATGFFVDRGKYTYMRDGSGFSAGVEYENRGYVNRIREALGEHSEYEMKKMHTPFSGHIAVPFSGEAIYVTFWVKPGDAPIRAKLDGKDAGILSFPALSPRYNDFCVYSAPFFCADGKHLLELEGTGYIENIETARGEYMVINAAVGSCMAERYEQEHLPQLAALKPYLTIMELHTVNDWLGLSASVGAVTPTEYGEGVMRLLSHGKKISEKVMAVTVAPVLGTQIGALEDYVYADYTRAAHDAIQRSGVPFADVYAAMTAAMAGMDEEAKKEKYYANNWHVNDNGYAIYTEEILKTLRSIL